MLTQTAQPRAIQGRVRADDPISDMINRINSAVGDMRADQDRRFGVLESALDQQSARIAAAHLGGGGGTNLRPDDPEYSRTFASFFRNGEGEQELRAAQGKGERATIQASMSSGSTSDGGYLAPTEWDRQVRQALVAVSPMRRLAQVVQTNVGAYSTLWNNAQWGSGWVGETASRPVTSTASLAPIVFPNGEIYAQPAATQRLLDDAQIDVGAWLATQVSTEFARQESIAFVQGDGVNKPAGFLTYIVGGANENTHPGGTLAIVNSGSATAISNSDRLVEFAYSLPAPYRVNASWLMNSGTAAAIAKLKDGEGNYLWRESFIVGQPATLLGRPVEIDENMPDIAAGSLSVAFGDFRTGYIVNDRIGVRLLRDPFTMKPYVLFYSTKRVGGGVLDPKAIRLLKTSV